jgi:hypothetical protein
MEQVRGFIVLLSVVAACAALGEAQEGFVAKGFAESRGGSGGIILRVTNLEATGPGSLRAALEAKGPRTIVFEVGGVVDLKQTTLKISEPFVTIAGRLRRRRASPSFEAR